MQEMQAAPEIQAVVPAKSVLIVEDDDEARRSLCAMIRSRGVTVTTAATMEEAMKLLIPCPDVLLLDLILPDGFGMNILRKLREIGCLTRVIIMTGVSGMDMEVARASQYGYEVMLPKPIKLHVLFFLLGL